MLEIEATVTKMNNYFQRLMSGLIMVEERTRRLEDRSLEIYSY